MHCEMLYIPITAKLPIGDKSDKHIPFAIPYQMIIGTRERFFLLLLRPLLEDRETDRIQFPPRVVKFMLRTIYIYTIHSHIIFPMNIPHHQGIISPRQNRHTRSLESSSCHSESLFHDFDIIEFLPSEQLYLTNDRFGVIMRFECLHDSLRFSSHVTVSRRLLINRIT